MKLFIKESTIVKGGKIVEAGAIHDTGDVERKDDREAFDLISTGRAVEAKDTLAVNEAKANIDSANKIKEKAAAAKDKTAKSKDADKDK